MADGVTFQMAGVEQLKRALQLVGPEVARLAGKDGNRQAMLFLRRKLKEAAPYRTGSTKKSWKLKGRGKRKTGSGQSRQADYGHLRDNIRFVAGRRSTRHKDAFFGAVGVGDAYWGRFLEFGTRKMSAKPWFRPTIDKYAGEAIRIQAKGVGDAIPKACRKYAARKARRRVRR